MLPAVISTLDALPVTPNGKVDRKALSARPVAAATVAADVAELTPDERRVAEAWRAVLDVGAIGPDDNFFTLGGDSFRAVRAMHALDPGAPVVELFRHPTVRELAAALRDGGGRAGELLQELTPPGRYAELNLLCVPYGGGDAVAFQPLADALPDRIALWAVDLPGHRAGSDEGDLLEFREAAERIVDEALMRIDGPIAVYGHCAGTWLAMEIARLLEDSGADLRAVYAGASLPHSDPEGSLRETDETSDDEWAAYLRSIGGLDGTLPPERESRMLRAGRHTHIGAMRFQRDSYRDRPRRLDAPLHAVFGDVDPALPNYATDFPDWRWYAHHVDVAVVRGGDHYFLRSHAPELAELIDRQLGGDDEVAPTWSPSVVPMWTIAGRSGLAPMLAGAREE
jgi:surfactin synthase thioesterase subunit